MRAFEIRAAILAAFLGATMQNGCVVVDDPQHCANRDGDKTCAELYKPGVHCSLCEHFYNGCVDDEPVPECRPQDTDDSSSDDEDGSSSGDEDGSSSDAAALECEGCSEDDASSLEAVR